MAVVMLTFPYDFPAEQVLRAYRQAMKLADDGQTAENWLSVSRWLHTPAAEGVKTRAETDGRFSPSESTELTTPRFNFTAAEVAEVIDPINDSYIN